MKLIEKIKTSKAFKKTVACIASASVAMSAFAINAFAADGDVGGAGGVNYGDISSKILSGFGTVITNCIDIATSIIPLGLGFYGVGMLWDSAKKFFTKATK
ncbi:MAG: hypothetical protein OSJ54_13720 [Oscillospiraceae bacterium]|nr:hypothetical protein [Oscillospiraceae bacterium]